MLHSAVSYLCINCLHRPVCPNTYGINGNTHDMSLKVRKCTFLHVRPTRLKSGCATAQPDQSDQSLHCRLKETLLPWLVKKVPSDDSDQTVQMSKLI